MKGAALASASLLLVACDVSVPGEVVGTYDISVALRENGCGAGAVYTNDGRSYAVELREDAAKGQGYWHVPKQKPIMGTIEGGTFTFAFDSVVVSTAADAGMPSCTLTQSEVLTGTFVRAAAEDAGRDGASDDDAADAGPEADAASLAADAEAPALEASHTLTIAPAAGSSCATALAPRGPFTALPCTVVYGLTGRARGPL